MADFASSGTVEFGAAACASPPPGQQTSGIFDVILDIADFPASNAVEFEASG